MVRMVRGLPAGQLPPSPQSICLRAALGLAVNREVSKHGWFLASLLLTQFLGKEVARVASWSAQVAGARRVIAAPSPAVCGASNVHVISSGHCWDDAHIVTVVMSPSLMGSG